MRNLFRLMCILLLFASVGCSRQPKQPTLVRCEHYKVEPSDQCFFSDGSVVVTDHFEGKTFSTYYSPEQVAKDKRERDKDLAQDKQIQEAEQHQK